MTFGGVEPDASLRAATEVHARDGVNRDLVGTVYAHETQAMLLQRIENEGSSSTVVSIVREVMNIVQKYTQVRLGLGYRLGRVAQQITRLLSGLHQEVEDLSSSFFGQ